MSRKSKGPLKEECSASRSQHKRAQKILEIEFSIECPHFSNSERDFVWHRKIVRSWNNTEISLLPLSDKQRTKGKRTGWERWGVGRKGGREKRREQWREDERKERERDVGTERGREYRK